MRACVCARLFSWCFVLSCGLSIPKRNFDWETPLGIKRICLAKVENDDFGPKSAWEILVRVCVRVPGFFRGAVCSWVDMTLAKCLTCLDHLAKCVKVTYKHLVSGVKST